ncbi:tyrosine-protein phosphatase [Enterococcus sp. 669A]|uniref:Tyrosine-protein phosphatase n=1 Tax=Candidatus Enterococcus moelleringii TaxID=2815325 RepID=A0ABS3LAC1_9ENTE|nr:tyrosine-protein phosphatase [Enterococcus sp. 669A]MBO1305686.1 tyrosine-protein phosphatase [Enterococcus sp. 669A]
MCIYNQPYTISGIEVKRESDKIEIRHLNKPGRKYQLFVGNSPNKQALTKLAAENETGLFQLDLPTSEGPYYFFIRGEDFETNLFGERVVQLEEAINVRDMGGYETADGRLTKWGLLFRGDQLSKLTEADVKLLERMGLKTIVDYRSEHERTLNPNREIGTVKVNVHADPQSSFSEAAANAIDLHEENAKLVRQLEEGKVEAKYINGRGENVIEDYRELVTSEAAQKAYSKFLLACAETDNAPLIHHCRGGKDRTGLGSMFLLLLLGVKEEEIIQDYILTGIIREERNHYKYLLYRELTDNEDYLAYLMAMIETRREFIKASIDRIYELYATVDDYFVQHLGLSRDQIEEMKTFYLEEG